MFKLKKPCSNCPFRKEGGIPLVEGRLEGIVESLHDNNFFACHKTINHEEQFNEEGEFHSLVESQFCAGALLYLEKCDNPNVQMRIAMRLGKYDPDKLEGHDEVIEPFEFSGTALLKRKG